MADIGIAYSLADRQEVAGLADGLTRAGHHVVCKGYGPDEFHLEDPDATAIDDADVVLVAWSANSRKSIWVRSTAERAMECDRLLQVKLGDEACDTPPVSFPADCPRVDQLPFIQAGIEKQMARATAPLGTRQLRLPRLVELERHIVWLGIVVGLISFTAAYIGLDFDH